MPVSISPLTEAEIAESVRIELEAFRSHLRTPMLWTRGYTDDLYAFYELDRKEMLQDPECRLMKAIDDETGNIVAVSEWTFSLDPAKQIEKKPVDPNGRPPANWPTGGNWELRRFFNLNSEKWTEQYLTGKPYIKLDILVTNPDFQRRGAASKLLSWGVDEADKLGIDMALEATPAGLLLYKRFGFKEIDVVKADMKQFGWKKPYDEEAAKRIWMIRQPQSTLQARSS